MLKIGLLRYALLRVWKFEREDYLSLRLEADRVDVAEGDVARFTLDSTASCFALGVAGSDENLGIFALGSAHEINKTI